jgi:hypothetical protein
MYAVLPAIESHPEVIAGADALRPRWAPWSDTVTLMTTRSASWSPAFAGHR